MTRSFRRIAPFLCALMCVALGVGMSACRDASSSNVSEPAPPASPAPSPLPDVKAMIKRLTTMDGSKDFTAEMRMTSVNEEGKRDQIEFKIQRKFSTAGAATFLTVLAPREESDKAFLAIEKPGQPTEGFSYLPGLKRLAKLNSERQLGFRRAKVTVQEMLGMELNQYDVGPGRRMNENGVELIEVELKEKPDLNIAYPRLVAFFREADEQPVRFDLYGDNRELQKQVRIQEVKQIQNRQTITNVAIDDLQQKLKIKLETRQVEYDRGLSDSIFTEDHLKNFISGASRRLDH